MIINKNNFIKFLFFLFFVKPFIFWALGINVRGMEKLPKKGPAIIVSNHNSHIDTLIIMSLFSMSTILKMHPIAAEDYFCNTKIRAFIFKTLIGIIPIKRNVQRRTKDELFKDINKALNDNRIIIIYPEGTRGEDNTLGEFKTGIAHIAKMNPNVPIIPLYINGPDKILPKIDAILVPFISDIYVADTEYYDDTTAKNFTNKIRSIIEHLYFLHKKKEAV